MTRFTNQFAAIFAAVAITLVSMQVVTSVPSYQIALIEAPAIA